MTRKFVRLFSITSLFMLLIVASCSRCSKTGEDKNTPSDTSDSTVIDTVYNQKMTDIAMFIAGMPVDSNSNLYKLTQNAGWKAFSRRMDESWKTFFTVSDSSITPWINASLGNVSDSVHTLFYPFSGPDFINADLFFPGMKKYILFGLESAGSLPDPLSIDTLKLPDYYKMYEQSIYHIIHASFFRTNSMKEDLSSMEVDGTTPVLMIFLARSGKKIIDIQPFEITKNGEMSYDPLFNNYAPENKYKHGVEITFREPNDTMVQKLIYFSVDISDEYLEKNPEVLKFITGVDSVFAVYIKSASYLLHNSYFRKIRDCILGQGEILLQDDSGIPYSFFKNSDWKVELYGVYDKPIPMFSNYFQQNLYDD